MNSTLCVPRTSLPAPLTRFIGRAGDILVVHQLLSQARGVTLVGAGGAGKTRLALQVGSECERLGCDHAVWVDLAPLSSGADVLVTAAKALCAVLQTSSDYLENIVRQVGQKKLLIIFDNCEHVLHDCAHLIEHILAGCPAVRIISTSRGPLRISGEVVWQVPPLPTPEPSAWDPLEIGEYAGVKLFVERASAVQPMFKLDRRNASVIASICRRLDGIPLAIELAAARVNALSPQQILDTLDNSLHLLSSGYRTALPRHQTLRASIDWSYNLLSDAEKVLLRRLAVFAGHFSLDAVQAVCSAGIVPREPVIDIFTSLADKSMIVVENGHEQCRYRLLDTVRRYALELLENADDFRPVHDRLVVYAVEWVEQAALGLQTDLQPVWLSRIDDELNNLRTALDWSIATNIRDAPLLLANGLTFYFITRCNIEGRRWFANALDAGDDTPSIARGRALWGAAYCAFNAVDIPAARSLAHAALEVAHAIDDKGTAARALDILGSTLVARDPAQARHYLEQSVVLAREVGDTWCLCNALQFMSVSWLMHNALHEAQHWRDLSFEVVQKLNNPFLHAWHWIGVALVAFPLGKITDAIDAVTRASAIATDIGEPICTAWTSLCHAEIACWQGQAAQARRILAALDTEQNISSQAPYCDALMALASAKCNLRVGDCEIAIREFKRAYQMSRTYGWAPYVGSSLIGLAEAALASGDLASVPGYLDEATAYASQLNDTRLQAAALFVRCRAKNLEGDLGESWELGHQALLLQRNGGYITDAIRTLATIAGLCVERGAYPEAARLFAAVAAARRRLKSRWPVGLCDRSVPARRTSLRQVMRLAELRSALREGAALTLEDAIAYAIRGRGLRSRPVCGWASLTETELAVARRIAQGLSNPDIAAQLLMSRSTVKTHLTHIFHKLDVATRTELAVLATNHINTDARDIQAQDGTPSAHPAGERKPEAGAHGKAGTPVTGGR